MEQPCPSDVPDGKIQVRRASHGTAMVASSPWQSNGSIVQTFIVGSKLKH